MTTPATTTMTPPPATLADGFPFTSMAATPPRLECSPAIDPDVINDAMAAEWGQGARVELAREGRVRFLNVYGDGEAMQQAAFHFVAGFLSALRAD